MKSNLRVRSYGTLVLRSSLLFHSVPGRWPSYSLAFLTTRFHLLYPNFMSRWDRKFSFVLALYGMVFGNVFPWQSTSQKVITRNCSKIGLEKLGKKVALLLSLDKHALLPSWTLQ